MLVGVILDSFSLWIQSCLFEYFQFITSRVLVELLIFNLSIAIIIRLMEFNLNTVILCLRHLIDR